MKAKISIEAGIGAPDNGVIKVWWRKDGAKLK